MIEDTGPSLNMSHPLDSLYIMMNFLVEDTQTSAIEAFAAAEQALLEAGIGFSVVEEPEAEVAHPPLAA